MEILDGKKLSQQIKEEIKQGVSLRKRKRREDTAFGSRFGRQ